MSCALCLVLLVSLQVIGPVVDVRFDGDNLPDIMSCLVRDTCRTCSLQDSSQHKQQQQQPWLQQASLAAGTAASSTPHCVVV